MANQTKQEYKITDGPSREELFDALRLFNERRSINFTFCDMPGELEFTLPLLVLGIAVEDGSSHNWVIKVDPSWGVSELGDPFDIYYNDKRRKGIALAALRMIL